MDSVIIRLVENFPLSIQGITIVDANGDYNVYVNGAISDDAQISAYEHELEHIKQGHFYTYLNLTEIESLASHDIEE